MAEHVIRPETTVRLVSGAVLTVEMGRDEVLRKLNHRSPACLRDTAGIPWNVHKHHVTSLATHRRLVDTAPLARRLYELGVPAEQVAKLAGLNPDHVRKVFKQKRTSAKMALALAEAMGMDPIDVGL